MERMFHNSDIEDKSLPVHWGRSSYETESLSTKQKHIIKGDF